MKKLLATSALAALLAVSAQAKFEGAYSGIAATYHKQTLKIGTTNGTSGSLGGSAFGGALNGGYGTNLDSVYLGGEIQVGYNSVKKKKYVSSYSFKINTNWNALVGALVGGHFQDNWLGYGYLGLGYEQPTVKEMTTSQNKKLSSYSIVPGVGTRYMFNGTTYLDVNYKYGITFKQSKLGNSLQDAKSADKLKTHMVALGVGYQF